MIESLQNGMAVIKAWLVWLPDSILAVVMLAFAATIAVSVHTTLLKLVNRALGTRFPYARTLLAQTTGVSRLALLLFALVVTVPLAPFDYATGVVIARVLLIALVILVGWVAMTAISLAADLYLMRYQLDTRDNLLARKHVTQVRVLQRVADTMVILFTIGASLMTFESVRQYGVSVFASAGVAGLVAGLAARPVLSNLFAGIQLAVTQPIRIDDQVVVEGENGRVEEITSTYVVIRLWDLRRLVVPLTYFIEKPFQNWTRDSSELVGSVRFFVDYSAPIEKLRAKLTEIVEASPLWNKKTAKLQVIETHQSTLELRALVSANFSGAVSDLRDEVREKLIDYLQRELPDALPRQRQVTLSSADDTDAAPAGKAAAKNAKKPSRRRASRTTG